MSGLKKTSANFEFVSIKRHKADKKYYFTKMEKTSEGWELVDKYDELTGRLESVELSDFEYEGEVINQLVFIFNVGENVPKVKVESNFHMISRSLINTIVGALPDIILGFEITISLYVSKKGYNAICVREVGTSGKDGMYGWEFQIDELPEPVEHIVGKGSKAKSVWDYSELDDFITKLVVDRIQPALKGLENTAPIENVMKPSFFDDEIEPTPTKSKSKK